MKRRSWPLFFVFMVLLVAFLNGINKTVAQTTEQLIAEKALSEFQQKFNAEGMVAENGTPYSDYEASFVEEHNGWARVHISSVPEVVFTSTGEHNWPLFQGAIAHEEGGAWVIYFNNTPEFESLKSRLPDWLAFLDVPSLAPQMPVSVPGLPWEMGGSWRFNTGFHPTGQFGLDFGTNPQGSVGRVYAMEDGEVIRRVQSCIYVKRPSDGLIIFYQHIKSADLTALGINQGKLIKYGDYLGTTNSPSLDCGAPANTGHHVHIDFQIAIYSHPDPTGSTMNGWAIVDSNTLSKNGENVDSGQSQRIYHDGCPDTTNTSIQLRLFSDRGCTGLPYYNIHTFDGRIDLSSVGGGAWDNRTSSIQVGPGYAAKLWLNPGDTQYACADGSLWDMSKDFFPGTSQSLYDVVSAVQVVTGTCAEIVSDPDCAGSPTVDIAEGAYCEAVVPPPPDVYPLPPGPQTYASVKIYAYANFEGGIFFNGTEGFSNAPNAEGYSLEIPSGWSVITYRDDNSGGMSRCWNQSVPNLQDHEDWQNKTQSIQIFRNFDACPTEPPSSPDGVRLYDNPNYSGYLNNYNVGFHDYLQSPADSMQVPSGWSVFLYRWDKRQVQAQCFNTDVPNLNDTGNWDNEVYGIEVFNSDLCQDEVLPTHAYIVYTDEGDQGNNCGSSGTMAAPDLTNWCGGDWNDRISSLRIRNGWSIKVWEHANYQGGDVCFTSTLTTMRNNAFSNGTSIAVYPPDNGDRDSRISSFAVFDNEFCDGSPTMPESAWAYPLNNGNLALGRFIIDVADNNDQSVMVEWTASLDYVSGYHVYEHNDNDVYTLLATVDSNTTSWEYNTLPCGTDYHFLVRAFNEWGDSPTPNLVTASTPSCYVPSTDIYLPIITSRQEGPEPNAPTNFRFVDATETTMQVAWDDNSDIETQFNIKFRPVGSSTWSTAVESANFETYMLTYMACGTSYEMYMYALRYVNPNEQYVSAPSNWIYPTTATCSTNEDGPTPNAPTNFHLVDFTDTTIHVGWDDNSGIETQYEISFHAVGNTIWQTAYDSANAEEYTLTLLTCGTLYEMRVYAVRYENSTRYESTYSDWVAVATSPCAPGAEGPNPNAPTNLHAVGTTTSSMTIGWNDNSNIEEQYDLWYKKASGEDNYWSYAMLSANATSTTASGLGCGTQYYVHVRAVNIEPINYYYFGGSTLVTITTSACGPDGEGPVPNRPSNLHSSSTSTNSISVAWNDNSTIEDQYEVWYLPGSGGNWTNLPFPANTTDAVISGLNCGSQYYIHIRSVNFDNGYTYFNQTPFYIIVTTSSC